MTETQEVQVGPKFPHDAECDTFLGTEMIEGRDHDLYVCPSTPTYIARYGEGDNYVSGRAFVGIVPAITRSHELATERGIGFEAGNEPLSATLLTQENYPEYREAYDILEREGMIGQYAIAVFGYGVNDYIMLPRSSFDINDECLYDGRRVITLINPEVPTTLPRKALFHLKRNMKFIVYAALASGAGFFSGWFLAPLINEWIGNS